MTQNASTLAVTEGNAAVEFYENAFGGKLLCKPGGKEVVAGCRFGGARFFLAHEAPEYGTRRPMLAGFTTVRVELFVDDPVAVQQTALGRRHRAAQFGYGRSVRHETGWSRSGEG